MQGLFLPQAVLALEGFLLVLKKLPPPCLPSDAPTTEAAIRRASAELPRKVCRPLPGPRNCKNIASRGFQKASTKLQKPPEVSESFPKRPESFHKASRSFHKASTSFQKSPEASRSIQKASTKPPEASRSLQKPPEVCLDLPRLATALAKQMIFKEQTVWGPCAGII